MDTKDNSQQEAEVERLLRFANLHRIRKEWLQAEDYIRKALVWSPDNPDVHEMLGDMLRELGKPHEALEEYKTAREIAPGNAALETKYATIILEVSEAEHAKAVALDVLSNPQKLGAKPKNAFLALTFSALIPGWGQIYNGEMKKGAILFGLFLLTVILFVISIPHSVTPMGFIALLNTSPIMSVFLMMWFMITLYAIIDAPLVAAKKSKRPESNDRIASS
jgi:tetratricopeptide (TPR) repeat protein